jgi:hypothetical protein
MSRAEEGKHLVAHQKPAQNRVSRAMIAVAREMQHVDPGRLRKQRAMQGDFRVRINVSGALAGIAASTARFPIVPLPQVRTGHGSHERFDLVLLRCRAAALVLSRVPSVGGV